MMYNYIIQASICAGTLIYLLTSKFFGIPFGDALSYVVGSIDARKSKENIIKIINTYGIYNAFMSKIENKLFYTYVLPISQLLTISFFSSLFLEIPENIIAWGLLIFLLVNTREGVHMISPGARFFGNFISWTACYLLIRDDPNILILTILILISVFSGKFWLQNAILIILMISLSENMGAENKILFFVANFIALAKLGFIKKITEHVNFLKYEFKVQIAFDNNISKFKIRDIKRFLGWVWALVAVSMGIASELGDVAAASYFIFVSLVFLTPLKIIGVAERYIIAFTPFVLLDYRYVLLFCISLAIFVAVELNRKIPIWKGWNNAKVNRIIHRLHLEGDKIIVAESVRMADYIKYMRPDLNVMRVNIGNYNAATTSGIINHNKLFEKNDKINENSLNVLGLHPSEIRLDNLWY